MVLDLSQLLPLREVITQHNLRAEKKLGQNFILDSNITDKIARVAGNVTDCHILEVGPGPGGLTRSLLEMNPKSVTAIEYDDRAIMALQDLVTAANGQFHLIKQDALQCNFLDIIPAPRVIVANLPYNISTVLLLKWLKDIYHAPDSYERLILMFQKEVAERIVASPHCKEYGRLSVMTQWLATARIVFDVPPHIFVPPPKVTSSIVEIIPHKNRNDIVKWDDMEALLAAGFGQRRKMIRSSLSSYKHVLEKTTIEQTLRAENLSVQDYICIADVIRACA
jgi:16S rRNA (adenine1518-N6/adenine1519-N6)-dimethyltransferase